MFSLASTLAERTFRTLDDGTVIFYPNGPLFAYFVPDAECRARVASHMTHYYVFVTLTGWAEIVLWFWIMHVFKFAAEAIVLPCLALNCLHYWTVMRRITNGLVRLPLMLGLRLYAQQYDEKQLRAQFLPILILSVITIAALLFGGRYLISLILLLSICAWRAIVTSMLLYARRHEAQELV